MANIEVTQCVYIGRKRVFYAERVSKRTPHGIRLQGDVWHWYGTEKQRDNQVAKIRAATSRGKRGWSRQEKFETIVCACGCGQSGTVTYLTRPPRFLDDTHRRAYDKKRRASKRAEANAARILAEAKRALRNEARRAARALGNSSRGGRVEGESVGEGEGASPSPTRARGKGMFADKSAPERGLRRRDLGLPEDGEE